jgi:hypothetical protein
MGERKETSTRMIEKCDVESVNPGRNKRRKGREMEK